MIALSARKIWCTRLIDAEPYVIQKRSVLVAGHRTSVSLEVAFWQELVRLSAVQGKSLNQLVTEVDAGRKGNLSSALRLLVLSSMKG